MTNISIDNLLEKIQDARIREYMDEVLSCYYSGNYRSAVVMLYSVVMCDLIFKLQKLADQYQDKVSLDILANIEKIQNENPVNPAWEKTLREEMLRNHRIISTPEAAHLESLQKDRHLCAHPVISDNAELHRPSKAAVYSHIITAMDEILTRPALLNKEILTTVLHDIAGKKDLLKDQKQFRQYVETKFLKDFNSAIYEKFFVDLWKFVFKLNNKDAEDNRQINFQLLKITAENNRSELNDIVNRNSEKLSANFDFKNPMVISCIIDFFNGYPEIYKDFNEPFHIALEATIAKSKHTAKDAFFLHSDYSAYYQKLLDTADANDDVNYLMYYIENRDSKEAALRLPINILSRSYSFDNAWNNFRDLILPYLDEMSLNNLQELLDAISGNAQIRASWKVQDYFSDIKETALKKDPDFDFSKYNFIK